MSKVGLFLGGALALTLEVPATAVAQSQRGLAVSPSASGARPRPVAGNPYEETPVPTPGSKDAGERSGEAIPDQSGATKRAPVERVTGPASESGVAGGSSSKDGSGASSESGAARSSPGRVEGESPAPVSVVGERTSSDVETTPQTTPDGETELEHEANGEVATDHDPDGEATAQHVGEGAAKAAPRAKPSVGRSLSVGRSNTSEAQPMFGTFEGTYLLGGLASGVSFGPNGVYLGGELSLVRQFQEFAWLGAYVDGVYDFGRDQTRFSVGPEVGWSALGLDGGYLLALDGAGAHSGVTARPLISVGFVTAYGRVSHLFEPKSTWLEAGLLLKYPFEL